MVDYWLADYFGRAWLRVHKGLAPGLGHLTGLCQAVARCEPLPAGQLWQAQDFAVRVWWRSGMASVLALVVIGITAKEVAQGAVLSAAVAVVATLSCFMAVAGAQVVMLRYRSDRTRLYLRKAGAPAREQPLPPGSPGLPRRSDFWLMLIITLAVVGILWIASGG
jgi:hypothetical protein